MAEKIYPTSDTETILAENVSFADYLVQYDGQQTEWQAGKVVQQVSNNSRHQIILGFLYRLLMNFLELRELGQVILAGLPMYINDEVSARQPDLMIVLNPKLNQIKVNYFEGPADIVVEIVSPGSERVDRADKLVEYEAAGVPEYWLIDPLRKEAVIYVLNEEGIYQANPLDDERRLQSTVLIGFLFNPAVLWQEQLPKGSILMQMAQEMADNISH